MLRTTTSSSVSLEKNPDRRELLSTATAFTVLSFAGLKTANADIQTAKPFVPAGSNQDFCVHYHAQLGRELARMFQDGSFNSSSRAFASKIACCPKCGTRIGPVAS